MANGADVVYPKGNAPLLDAIAHDHLIVSELPPGAAPSRVRFLARNRLIAAISTGTVVVEAAHRSGARNTASWAVDCGRQLMAVPGPVYSAVSAGPHQLVRDGTASLVTSGAEVLELVAPMGSALAPEPRGAQRATDLLDERRLAVCEALPARSYASVGYIARRAGVAGPTPLAVFRALEQAGLAEASDRGWRTSPVERPVEAG
jgi:DNA processing protein